MLQVMYYFSAPKSHTMDLEAKQGAFSWKYFIH